MVAVDITAVHSDGMYVLEDLFAADHEINIFARGSASSATPWKQVDWAVHSPTGQSWGGSALTFREVLEQIRNQLG